MLCFSILSLSQPVHFTVVWMNSFWFVHFTTHRTKMVIWFSIFFVFPLLRFHFYKQTEEVEGREKEGKEEKGKRGKTEEKGGTQKEK